MVGAEMVQAGDVDEHRVGELADRYPSQLPGSPQLGPARVTMVNACSSVRAMSRAAASR